MGKIVGLDLGGNAINVTAYDGTGFLIEGMCELPSLVREGPETCVNQLTAAFARGLEETGWAAGDIDAVGLGSPGPVSGDGVLCAAGATNFGPCGYENFDLRGALSSALDLPVAPPNVGLRTTPAYNDANGKAVSGAATYAALDSLTSLITS